jgi:hypothetical protein
MISISIPEGLTALSVVGSNCITEQEDGCDFVEDGYIYKKGVRIKKWFSPQDGWNHFWAPLLNDIARLEALYVKLGNRSKKHYAKISDVLRKISEIVAPNKNGIYYVHANPYKHPQEGKIWLYEIHKSDMGSGLAYCFNWVSEPKPEEYKFIELGNELYELDSVKNHFLYKIEKVLNRAFQDFLSEKKSAHEFSYFERDTLFEITVNSRKYVYYIAENRYGGVHYEKLIWPGDRIQSFRPHLSQTQTCRSKVS